MKIFVLVAFASVAWADVSHLVNNAYVPPVTSYGAPSGSYLPVAASNVYTTPFLSNVQPSVRYGSQQVSYTGQPSSLFSTGFQPSVSSQGYNYNYATGSQPSFSSQGFNYNYGSGSQPSVDVHVQPHTVEHRKSFYFYSAPEEPEQRSRITIPIPPPQKRTNYIFVKAPVSRPQHVPVVIPQGGVDQKTVVYVLVKKNDENVKPIILPGPAPLPQQKPEVVFLKYGSTNHVQNIIQGTLQGQQQPGSQDVDTNSFLGNIQHGLETGSSSNVPEIDLRAAPVGQTVDKIEGVQGSSLSGSFGTPGVSANYVSVGSYGHAQEGSSIGPTVVTSGVSSVGPSVAPSISPIVSGSDASSVSVVGQNYGPRGESGPY